MRSLISFELYGADFTDSKGDVSSCFVFRVFFSCPFSKFSLLLFQIADKNLEYCISGQTVREAYHLVLDKQNELTRKYRYLIVNVGAIDILLERDFVDIIAEYARLIRAIITIGLVPIITTIPNIAINRNNKNVKTIYQTLLLFNQFLVNTYKDGNLLVDLHLYWMRGFNSRYYYM